MLNRLYLSFNHSLHVLQSINTFPLPKVQSVLFYLGIQNPVLGSLTVQPEAPGGRTNTCICCYITHCRYKPCSATHAVIISTQSTQTANWLCTDFRFLDAEYQDSLHGSMSTPSPGQTKLRQAKLQQPKLHYYGVNIFKLYLFYNSRMLLSGN